MTHTEVALTRGRSLEQYQDNLHSNLEELQRMSRMIDDMLLAKADNGLIVPDAKPVALEQLCTQLLDYYQLPADERGVRFELTGAGTIRATGCCAGAVQPAVQCAALHAGRRAGGHHRAPR